MDIELIQHDLLKGFPVVKNLPANAGDVRDIGSIRGSGRSCLDLVFLPEEFHGRRSLVSYNP